MSDRSFGDHTNRNVVKNPLLSTAVIGLSLEDLTQNAVLLPAVPSQGVITTQDEQHETQTRPLRHPELDVTNLSSGDINSNPQNPQTHITNPLNNNKNTQNDKTNEASSMSTLSKASVKSTDDFDVNEYFARLQGTRYVSAPLNSNVSDQNANLQVEENLEEINLNESIEPEKPQALETQSLTADIAQNFSQLPNVLPHVASAVFSSFSNMLSLKTREIIPDEQKVQHNEQKAQHVEQKRIMDMPLGVPEAPVAVAPPPLPTTGTTSNYRITTKKKAYAQVPGLSSGDNQHKQTFNPGPFTQSAPSYFIPDNVSNTPYTTTTENVSIGFDTKPPTTDQSNKGYIYGLNTSRETDKHEEVSFREINQRAANDDTKDTFNIFNPTSSTTTAYQTELDTKISGQGNAENSNLSTHMTSEAKESFNMFHPTASVPIPTLQGKNENDQARVSNQIDNKESYNIFYPISPVSIQANNTVEITANSQSIPNLEPSVLQSEKQSDFMSQTKPTIEMQRDISSQTSMANPPKLLPQSWISNPFDSVPSAPQGSVIPPPPMFSNTQRKDSQTTVGKSVLPPSVARRISANQPILKPRALPTMVPQDNIFVPTIPYEPETNFQQNFGMSISSNLQNVGQDSSTSKSEINLQAQTLPRDNTQSQFQMPSLNQSVVSSLSKSSVPLISSSNTALPAFSSMPLIPRGSTTHSTTNMPPIETKGETTTGNVPTQHLQQTSLAFSHDNKTDDIASPSGLFQECPLPPKDIIQTPSTEKMIVSPPMFFNTASLNQANEPKSESDIHKNQGAESQDTFQRSGLFTMNAQSEPPKVIAEPPKLTGNLNYRMNKKKPQYYSGPITGVGNISNNVKPVLNPVGPSPFQGAIVNPDQILQPSNQNLTEDYSALKIGQDLPKPPTDQSSFQSPIFTPDLNVQPLAQKSAIDCNVPSEYVSHPFDLNKPPASSYPLDLNEQDRNPLVVNNTSTAFDLSRPVTERFEEVNKETKGFGIIGSLKSKLSSIDINKIQNTVTTFFDPTYNETKLKENNQEVISQYHGNYQNFPPTESTNLEVFIPSVNKEPQNANVSNQYQMDYSQTEIQPQYYKTQEYFMDTQNSPNDKYVGWNTYQPQSNDTNQKSFENLQSYTTLFSSGSTNEITEEKSLKEKENEKIMSISIMPGSLPKMLGPIKKEELSDGKDIISEDIGNLRGSSEDSKFFNTGNSSLKTFFDYSKPEPQSVFETINIKDIKNINTEYGQTNVVDAFQSTLDQPKIEQGSYQLKCTTSSNEEPPATSKIFSNISAKDFFETQQFQENLIVSHPEKNNETDILSKSFFDNLVLNKNDRGDMASNNDLAKVLSNQKETDADTSKELLTTVVLPVLKDVSEDLVPPQFLDDSGKDKQIAAPSCENRTIGVNEGVSKLNQSAYSFFDLSEADNTSYTNMTEVEETMKNVALIENPEHVHNNSSLSDFYANNEPIDLKEDSRDLNICETCREVNKPEEKDLDDLTSQLIENITAPIQLANPVGHPFGNSNLVIDKSEISHTAEKIVESMQLPPPVELIDDISVGTNLNYGWSTNEANSTNVVLDHNYSIQPDPLSIGFFQDKTLLFENVPTNASDEIKALSLSQEDSILPRSMSIPTAPPEEDTKSDESGLDVHSIEQDAKKDFPIYEEFVLEPSETDDDKIEYKERERSSDDPIPDADTFTNRVERYQKMEVHPEPIDSFELNKDSKPFELPTSTSPALTIASYFDTGNYAVENHYRNSLTSPTTVTSFAVNSTASMRIPPGFEDAYKRSLILAASVPPGFEDQNITRIPDTSTQTPGTATVTFNPNIYYPPHTQILNLAKMTCSQNLNKNLKFDDPELNTMMRELVDVLSPTLHERLSAFSNIGESNKDSEYKAQIEPEATPSSEQEHQKTEEPKQESLPDPTNFFTSNVTESNEDSDVYSNFSRLSSYFTSPPKPDHSKSFFELSQSQDHYRHKPKNDSIEKNVKHFFETTELNASVNVKSSNIPENLIANKDLVNELTSIHNFTPTDEIVRTVNYFTVENAKEISIGEPILSSHLTEKDRVENYYNEIKNNQLGDIDESSLNFEDILKNCKYCCDATKNFTRLNFKSVDFDNFKVRKSMDDKCDTKKEGDSNMDVKKDNASKKGLSVNFLEQTFQEDNSDKIVTMAENRSDYSPVKHHWFYRVELEDKSIWRGFSAGDSKALEDAYNSPDLNENTVVATDGGRYDVNVMARLRTAVYWKDKPSNVMRCSWFYKGTAVPRYVPYTESVAEKLEEMYRHSVTTGEWHRRLSLPNDEMVVMHGPAVMVHFLQTSADAFTSTPQSQRQRVVRGIVESEIEDTEPSSIDHLLLMCHGVGSACDMRFRSVEEVVDDFRSASLQLVQSHYKNSYDSGLVGRVEVLPISWHSSLHSGETGVDMRLAAVTLESIPRLRTFTNDTLLDVLFYTSPVFCQTIIDTVCGELNRIYALFKKRNPDYKGGVSLGGHSLGSVILYDLLCHQMPQDAQRATSDKQYVRGTAGTGQPSVRYPRLEFRPDALYALGSPIAIFECIRGVQTLGLEFCLPTCRNFFNIFHPYDPIAYRIEPMVNPLLRDVKPSLIPHHKGRKRMHLELKDTMARVGADIKQKLIESIKSTWSSMWKTQPPPDNQLEKVVEEEMEKEQLNADSKEEPAQEHEITPDMLGKLNDGRRIDHVLQEAPFEMINEYLFAMSSHVCYWESEDTMLVMLREIYGALGVTPDCSVPQNTMTVQRTRLAEDAVGVDFPDSPSTSRGGS